MQFYEQAFVRATPENQGISSDLFTALLRELDASKDTEMHHFYGTASWQGNL